MARLRLFANLRETAGTGTVDVEGDSVGDVLDRAVASYGPAFAAGLAQAKVWVNGEPADRGTPLGAGDEVAVIPPVSGGAVVIDEDLALRVFMSAALLAALVLASVTSLRVFVVIVVAVVASWVWDLASYAAQRALVVNPYPLLVAVVAPAWGAYRWGFPGFAFAAMLGLAATLVLALFRPPYRSAESIGYTGLVSMVVAGAAGSLVLLWLRDPDEVLAYALVVVAAVVAGWLASSFETAYPFLDSNLAALVGAIVGGAVAGALWGPSLVAVLIAAVVAAVGLVAGRAVGSLLRQGNIALTQAPSGYLSLLDGPLFAAALFWVTISLVG